MSKGWSKDDALAVVDAGHRLQQAVINDVVMQYKTAQDRKLEVAKDRNAKRAGQRRRDAEAAAGRRLAAAYARTGELDPSLAEGRDQATASFVAVLAELAERVGSRVVDTEEAFTTVIGRKCREGSGVSVGATVRRDFPAIIITERSTWPSAAKKL